jgi:hypothetical protein
MDETARLLLPITVREVVNHRYRNWIRVRRVRPGGTAPSTAVLGLGSSPFLRHHERRAQHDETSRSSDTAFAHADVVMYRSYKLPDERDLSFVAINMWRCNQGYCADKTW